MGHIVRNLEVLRRGSGAQKTLDIFLAKYLCGSQYFSNMFCKRQRGCRMKLGYARVSTGDQTLDGQCQRLSAAGCEKLFEEKISGARRNRPKLEKLIEQLRKDDILVVTRLDRLAPLDRRPPADRRAHYRKKCRITVA